ncbi:hypothetical protein D3C71_947520 [compost metagenome]
MRNTISSGIVIACLLISFTNYGQPPCTSGPPSASDNCATAPVVALNGVYCDNTCSYTANDALWFKNSNVFCSAVAKQTVENNSFYMFQATSSSVSLTICTLPGCTNKGSIIGASGIQALIFNFPTTNGIGTCGSGAINGYYCLKQLSGTDCSSCGNPKGCVSTTVSGLTSGKFYYLMIDGYEGDCCPFEVQFTSNVSLPIELLTFDGESNTSGNELRWETASERNNSHFEIESSIDGTTWTKIGSKQGAGNSTQWISYSFLDREPAANLTYYRLKQLDFDGNYSFSNLISIRGISFDGVTFSPNPVDDLLEIRIKAPKNGLVALTFISILGVSIEKQFQLNEGNNLLKLDLSDELSGGIYLLKITNESSQLISSGKVIKN